MDILKKILGYVAKNLYQIINLIEALLRVLAGIVELTPSVNDDRYVGNIKNIFEKVKSFLLKANE